MESKVKRFLFLGWSIVLFVILLIFYVPQFSGKDTKENITTIDVWTQRLNNGEEKEILLPYNLYSEDRRKAQIYTSLPEEFDSAQTICFWTYFQDVEVYLSDEIIYSTDEKRFGKTGAPQWNYVEVPAQSEGMMLTIYLNSPYDFQGVRLDEVVFGSTMEIEGWIFGTYGFNQLMDLVLLTVGIGFILCALLQNIGNRYKICHLCFGVTALLFGIWLLCGMKGCPTYWLDSYTSTFIAYLAFFLIPIPLTMYVRMRALRVEKLVKVCDGMLAVECLNVIGVLLMQALHIRDIPENLLVGQVILSISVVWAMIVAMFYYIKLRKRISVLTVLNAFLLMLAVVAEYIDNSAMITQIRSDVTIRVCVITILIFEFLIFFRHLREKEKIQAQIQEENKNLQLQVLTGQIRPHFILNTLGAIRSLIRREPDRASDLLYDFSKYIRKNMEQKDYSKRIPFLEELDYIETYLKLETLRFNEKLKVEYDIQEKGFWILPLTIQPFVENAVKHGLLKRKQGGTIWISTYKTEKEIVIEIKDNGVGFDTKAFWAEFERRKSVGMRSAIFRLRNEMWAVCEIESRMDEGKSGTCVKISIPEKEAYRNENNNRR